MSCNETRLQLTKGLSVSLSYNLLHPYGSWDADKIESKNNFAMASFPAGEIHDSWEVLESGIIRLTRRWILNVTGKVRLHNKLLFNQDFNRWLVPSVMYAGNRPGVGSFSRSDLKTGASYREDRTSIPSCALLWNSRFAVGVFTEPSQDLRYISSIQIKPDFLAFHIPFVEEPYAYRSKFPPRHLQCSRGAYLKSDGSLDYQRDFYLITDRDNDRCWDRLFEIAWRLFDAEDKRVFTVNWERLTASKASYALAVHYIERFDCSGFITQVGKHLIPFGNTISPGFVGKNAELALTMYRYYKLSSSSSARNAALKTANFITRGAIGNGLYCGDYHLGLRRWVGYNFPGTKHLNTRILGEMAYNLLRLYQQANSEPSRFVWFEAAREIVDFFVEHQLRNGSLGKWWSRKGELVSDQGTNGAHLIPALVEMHRMSGDDKCLRCARRAAEYYISEFVEPGIYWGDTLDAECIDKEAGHIILKALLCLHEVEPCDQYLEACRQVARFLQTWIYAYNVTFPDKSPLGKRNISTRGGTSVSVSHHHLDFYGFAIAYDFLRLQRITGDTIYNELAKGLIRFCVQLIADIDDPLGAPRFMRGWQPEQLDQTDWDYVSNTIWGWGSFKNVIAWVPALTLGAIFDIAEGFPDVISLQNLPDITVPDGSYYRLCKRIQLIMTYLNRI